MDSSINRDTRKTKSGRISRTRIFWPGSKKMPVKDTGRAFVDIQFKNTASEFQVDNQGGSIACHRDRASGLQVFHPGQLIQCQYTLRGWESLKNDDQIVGSVEHSILWQTEGKGDSDFGVHFFERRTPKTEKVKDSKQFFQTFQFRDVCPNSPLSYSGELVSIIWRVRVRFFMKSGRSITADQPFKVCLG